MKIGAYQFRVTDNPESNLRRMREGIEAAGQSGVRLLVFPECAVTGYPPHDLPSAADADFGAAERVHNRLRALAEANRMFLVAGTILRDGPRLINSAVVFRPDGKREAYGKRALWGWDRDNFSPGREAGVFEADALKVGVRICFEVRFPEYFRELYRQCTGLNLILFYDVSVRDDAARYQMIRGHIQTRAVENVCPVLACSACADFQTAPTVLFDASGNALAELERGKEGLLAYSLERRPDSFGERGRRDISDVLTNASPPVRGPGQPPDPLF